jgi:CPA1 family monovalent cation:H+ antiporter
LEAAADDADAEAAADTPTDALRRRALASARSAVSALRSRGEIGDDAFHRVEEELDWAEMSAAPREIA